MRKYISLFLLVVLLLGALPIAVSAAPIADLTALARYFPADAPVFVGVRTDAAFVEALDRIYVKVGEALPPGVITSDMSFSRELNNMAMSVMQGAGDFDTMFRPWLGDTAAVVIPSMQLIFAHKGGMQGVIALSVTDREAAEHTVETLLAQVLAQGLMKATREEAYTRFAPADEADEADDLPSILVTDDALFIGQDLTPEMPEASLLDNETFNAALSLLPADDYSVLAYADMSAIMKPIAGFARMGRGRDAPDLGPFLDAVGPIAVGFTIQDDRALTMDFVQTMGDASILDEIGIPLPTFDPVDLGFATYIPADALLAAQGTRVGPYIQAQFDSLRALDRYMEAQGIHYFDLGPVRGPGPGRMRAIGFGDMVTFINLAYAGMTGLNLEKDVLAWMDGDAATFVRVIPDPALGVTLDMSVVFEVGDPEAVDKVMTASAEAMTQYDIKFTEETIQDAVALVIPDLIRAFFPEDFPSEKLDATPKLDVLIGASDTIFAMGTRDAVTFNLLAPSGDSLAEDIAFIEAQTYILDGTQALYYLGVGPLVAVIDQVRVVTMADDPIDEEAPDGPLLKILLSLFDSGTISGVVTEDGDWVARFVLMLAE